MSIEKINENLKRNTFRNFVFFIPKLLLQTTNSNFQEDAYLLNKVIFLDNDLLDNLPDEASAKDYKLNEGLTEKSILCKKEIFEKNILDLFDEKENLPKSRFKYILNNYYDFILAGLAWCELQNGLINSPLAPTLSEKIKNVFFIQYEYFKKHCYELERSFKLEKSSDTDKDKALGAFIMDLYTLCDRNNEPATNSAIKEDSSIANNDNCVDTSNRDETNGTDDKTELTLSHYMLHDKRKVIEKVIVENFKGGQGKTLRCIIEYLVGRNVLALATGDQQKIYNAFENLFDHNIGRYQSMFGVEVDKAKDKTYKAVRLKFINLLKEENIHL